MPTRSLILPDFAAAASSAGTLGLVVVPLKVQPPPSVQSVELVDNVWLGIIRRDPELAADGSVLLRETTGALGPRSAYECPFRVGSLLRVREAWDYPYTGCDPRYVRYRAGYTPLENDYAEETRVWRSAATMPRWASRSALRVVSVEARRVGTITADECWDAGFREGASRSELPYYYAIDWNHRHRKFPFPTWPWAWFVRTEAAAPGTAEGGGR